MGLTDFLNDPVVPCETDEVTRLIIDSHDQAALAPIARLTVGGLRDWLLSDEADGDALNRFAPGLTSPRSMSVYFTYQPRIGRTDEQRNCISNTHPQG